jgi:opacity protein-like surface antigen
VVFGGKNFKANGYGIGVGIEFKLIGPVDPWSFRAEYTYVNLGKGSNSDVTCTGSASACAAFSGISLDSAHNSFTANVFRVGINYKF